MQVLEDDDLNIRTRKLKDDCIFGFLNIYYSNVILKGFPSIQVFFSANTNFESNTKADYFLTLDDESIMKQKIENLWNVFCDVFAKNDDKRKEHDELMKIHEAKKIQYLKDKKAGKSDVKEPDDFEPKQMTYLEVENWLPQQIYKLLKENKIEKGIEIVKEINENSKSDWTIVKVSSRVVLSFLIENSYPVRVKVIFNSLNKDADFASQQFDFSMDARLNQKEMFEEYFRKCLKRNPKLVNLKLNV